MVTCKSSWRIWSCDSWGALSSASARLVGDHCGLIGGDRPLIISKCHLRRGELGLSHRGVLSGQHLPLLDDLSGMHSHGLDVAVILEIERRHRDRVDNPCVLRLVGGQRRMRGQACEEGRTYAKNGGERCLRLRCHELTSLLDPERKVPP